MDSLAKENPQVGIKDKEAIDYTKIDPDIADLVRTLNEIPFVATISSCSGHLKDTLHQVSPDDGCKFILGGDLIFDLDKSHLEAVQLLKEIRSLVKKYSFSELHEHHCNEEECSIGGAQVVSVNYDDLTHPERITDNDSFELMIKKRHQVEASIGRQRLLGFKQFWSDLSVLADKFTEKHDSQPKS